MSFILPVKMDQEVNSIVYMQEMYVKTSTRIFSSVPILMSFYFYSYTYIQCSVPLLEIHNYPYYNISGNLEYGIYL